MAAVARPHTKLGQRDFRKIYPNVWRRDCFYGVVYPPGPLGKVQVGGGCGFIFSLVEFAVNERCFLKGFAFLLFQVQSASCVMCFPTSPIPKVKMDATFIFPSRVPRMSLSLL